MKNWILQLSNHCFTQTNWKLNAVINTQTFKHDKLIIECCIQQSILQTVKNWMLQPSNHYLTQTHYKLNVSMFKSLSDINWKLNVTFNNQFFAADELKIEGYFNYRFFKMKSLKIELISENGMLQIIIHFFKPSIISQT